MRFAIFIVLLFFLFSMLSCDDLVTSDISTGGFSGTVVSALGNVPLDGVCVYISAAGTSVTNDKGQYFFNGIEPGTYLVVATKTGYATEESSVNIEQGLIKTVDLSMHIEQNAK